jgi:Tfp pilus assembly PilM family ATPase
VEGLIRSLNYVINEQNGVPLEKIILCGAASHLQNFDVFLAEQFSISVERYSHPLLDDLMKCMPASRAFSGRWTTALGLALAKEV